VNVLRSEWTKFVGLRSTWITAVVTVGVGVGVGLLASSGQARQYDPADPAGWDPTAVSLTSLFVGQLAIGVLGVLAMSGEYATGQITASVVAVPRRGRLLAAKAGVFAVVALVIGQVIGFASFFGGQALIAAADVPHASIGDPGVLRAVLGCGLYLVVLGLVGLGLATALRSTAGAIGTLVAITLLVRAVSRALPESWAAWMERYWPTAAGERVTQVLSPAGALPPWAGFGILCAFASVVGVAGYTLLRVRDT